MDLLSPILINFQMILGNTPELVQNLTNEDLGQMLKLNPILCRVELRPAKNNLPGKSQKCLLFWFFGNEGTF